MKDLHDINVVVRLAVGSRAPTTAASGAYHPGLPRRPRTCHRGRSIHLRRVRDLAALPLPSAEAPYGSEHAHGQEGCGWTDVAADRTRATAAALGGHRPSSSRIAAPNPRGPSPGAARTGVVAAGASAPGPRGSIHRLKLHVVEAGRAAEGDVQRVDARGRRQRAGLRGPGAAGRGHLARAEQRAGLRIGVQLEGRGGLRVDAQLNRADAGVAEVDDVEEDVAAGAGERSTGPGRCRCCLPWSRPTGRRSPRPRSPRGRCGRSPGASRRG